MAKDNSSHIGEYNYIIYAAKIVSASMIQSEISNGICVVEGSLTEESGLYDCR